jgi:WD40 repeat protein
MPTIRPFLAGIALLGVGLVGNPASSNAQDPKVELARTAQGILKTHCYKCHGEAGAVEGGFNYIADLERLINRKKIIPGKADQSQVYKRINGGTMPPPEVMPRVSDADKLVLKQWIDGGAPLAPQAQPRKFITQGEVQEAILADLERLDRRSRRFMRYFTFAHLHDAGLTDDELQTYRNALNKTINSLSWHPKVRNPEPVEPTGTVMRIDLRWYMWDFTIWNRILNDYPYGILDDSTTLRAIMVSTATKVPMLRGDWFVATATRPPLYQEILQLPANLAELERQLRVDSTLNITQERVMRVAFNGSGISKNNRILERHDAVHGYYWRSYDFEEVPQNLIERGQLAPDRRNVFAYPLGPGLLENAFQHAGGEAIFSLPNGLQAYYIMNAINNRLDRAPTQIVNDAKRPDKAVELGVSCMGCHIPGVHSKADQMHDFLLKNPKAIPKADHDIARSLYPPKEKTIAQMEEDSKKYMAAVALTGAKVARAEPIITMTLRYEADLDAVTAAAEAGLKLDDFQKKIGDSELLSRNLGALRVPGGTVGRQIWVQAFGDVVRDMKLGVLFQANQLGAALPDNTGELDPLEVAIGQSNQMAFSVDGTRAVIASADRSLQYYEVEGKRVLKRFVGHSASVWSVALSQDGKFALSGSMDGSVRYWRVEDGQQLLKLDGHVSLVTAVAFTPNGKWAVSGGFDGTVIYWSLTTGKEVKRYEGPMKYVNAVAVSPDGKRVLVAADRWLRLWDIETGTEVRKYDGHASAVNAVCFSSDGKKALSGSDDRTVRLWNVETGKQEQIFLGHENAVRAVAFNDKGNWALSGGSDSSVRLWKTADGKELGKFAKHVEPVVQVAFVSNGLQNLSGSRDTAVLLWSIEKFNPTPKLDPKVAAPPYAPIDLKPSSVVQVDGTIGKLILSPNKKWLFYLDVTNGVLGQIDAATGKQKKTLKVDAQLMALSDDGKALYVAGSAANANNGTLYVIDPVTLELRSQNDVSMVPFALSHGAGTKVFLTGAGDGFTSVAMLDTAEPPVKYIAPIKGNAQMQWLPGKLVTYPNLGAKEFQTLKLPIDPNNLAPERTLIPDAAPFTGPPQTTPDGKFLISRTGNVMNTGDLKADARIDPFLSLAVDVETNMAFALNDKGWLKQYSYPDWKEQKKWKLPITAYQIAIDAKGGKMYLSVVDPEAIKNRPRAKGFGDVWVIEMKDLK